LRIVTGQGLAQPIMPPNVYNEISGMTTDTIVPQADATRAQAAAMIYKLLTVLGK